MKRKDNTNWTDADPLSGKMREFGYEELQPLSREEYELLIAELVKDEDIRRAAYQCLDRGGPLEPLATAIEPRVRSIRADINVLQLSHITVEIYSRLKSERERR